MLFFYDLGNNLSSHLTLFVYFQSVSSQALARMEGLLCPVHCLIYKA